MYQVIKRTGETVAFDIKKIENAIVRAFVATNKNYNEDVIQMLALRASSHFSDKVTKKQNSVLNHLFSESTLRPDGELKHHFRT